MDGLQNIIRRLEAQKAAIDRALTALREVSGIGGEPATAPAAATKALPKTKRKRGMTPEGRKRLAESMKRRWAVKRTAAQATKRPGRPKKVA
jgi:type II secretory pathway component PulM